MIVNIKDIESVTLILLLKLKEKYGYEIEIKNDFYWDIVSEELFNPYEDPKHLTLGQLSDDYERLKNILDDNNPVIHDLKLLSIIFKTLSIENDNPF